MANIKETVEYIYTASTSQFTSAIDKAGDSVNQLGEDVVGGIEGIEGLDTSMGGLMKTALKVPGPMKAVAVGVAAVGGAALGAEKNSNMLNDMMLQLGPTVEATGQSMENAVGATNDLYVATGDLEGATAAVNAAMGIYGDTIETNAGLTAASASIYMVQSNGILDVADASKIGASAIDDFGASNLEANAAIAAGEELMAKYPGQVDDIGDSFKEFGDTLAGVGFDLNEFFTLMNVGMELGAKNTDEIVNSMNEMIIKTNEMGEETAAAYELIGISSAKAQEMLASGQGPELLAETLFALNGVTDATMQANAAAAIFGTMGEEFITPMLKNQSEAITQLETTYNLNNQAMSQMTGLMAGELFPTLLLVGGALGFNETQMSNLAIKYQEGGFAALDLTEKVLALATGMIVNGASMGLSADQATIMKDKLIVLTDETIPLQEKLAVLNGEMLKFFFGGVLNEEQTALLTQKITEQKATINEQIVAYQEMGGASGYLTNQLWTQYGAQIQTNTGMTEGEFAALGYYDKIVAVSDAMGLNIRETDSLKIAMSILNDETATSTEKAQALKDMMTTLVENGYTPSIDALQKIAPLITAMNEGFTGSTIKSNELTGEFAGMGKNLDTTSGELKDYTKKLEDSLSPMEKARRKAREVEDAFYGVGDAANYSSGEVGDLNTALQTNSTLPPPQSVNASVNSLNTSVNSISGFNNSSTNNSTNQTTNNFNISTQKTMSYRDAFRQGQTATMRGNI